MNQLAHATWITVTGSCLAVPLGSTEQHGPHLPLNTDTVIAIALVDRLVNARASVCAAPPLPYGSSGEHQRFTGTLSIGNDALRLLLIELVRSAAMSFERVLFVNGHGGNHLVTADVVKLMSTEGHTVAVFSPHGDYDLHAGHEETSILLHVAPDLVDTTAAEVGNTADARSLWPALSTEGVHAVSPNGVLGDPTRANADEGKRILQEMSDQLIDFYDGWSTPS